MPILSKRNTNTFEFSLNYFHWIQRIQWIMTKSKSSMVTRDILHLTKVTFLDIVVKSNFPLVSVGWYLHGVVIGNGYLPRGSNENTPCITSTGNVSVARWVIPLVTILLLDMVMIHWIRWIQGKSFRENSNIIKVDICLHWVVPHRWNFIDVYDFLWFLICSEEGITCNTLLSQWEYNQSNGQRYWNKKAFQ